MDLPSHRSTPRGAMHRLRGILPITTQPTGDGAWDGTILIGTVLPGHGTGGRPGVSPGIGDRPGPGVHRGVMDPAGAGVTITTITDRPLPTHRGATDRLITVGNLHAGDIPTAEDTVSVVPPLLSAVRVVHTP